MIDELIIRYCSPTLAGLKTGSIFMCSYESEITLKDEIRALNHRLRHKKIRIIPLKIEHHKAMIYVYRPSKLKEDLTCQDAVTMLTHLGYCCDYPGYCLVQLVNKLRTCADFPHEIGLFLGYPPEDVQGFIENKAQKSKCSGCWKVYGDERKAKKLFSLYKECTRVYIRKLTNGYSIERLTVAV